MESKKADNMMNQQDDVPGGKRKRAKRKEKEYKVGYNVTLKKERSFNVTTAIIHF